MNPAFVISIELSLRRTLVRLDWCGSKFCKMVNKAQEAKHKEQRRIPAPTAGLYSWANWELIKYNLIAFF